MEARAINRYIGTSPRKMRLVIDLIRGKSVDEALHILHFSPKHASKVAEKVLRSAVSNLQNKDEGGRLEPDDMVVKEAFVDGGHDDEADQPGADGARVPDPQAVEPRHDRRGAEGSAEARQRGEARSPRRRRSRNAPKNAKPAERRPTPERKPPATK